LEVDSLFGNASIDLRVGFAGSFEFVDFLPRLSCGGVEPSVWDFSSDEWAFFLTAMIVTFVVGARYYRPVFSVRSMGGPGRERFIVGCLPIVAIVPTCAIVGRWADREVVGHLDYMTLFVLGAAGWALVASQIVSVFGISVRDDVLERRNPAAMIAVCGIVMGAAMVYALCNIGSGPTIWTTIVPALLGTALLFGALFLAELIGGSISDSITIDRDFASGTRLAGAMFGCGIVLGRAGAGDWISWPRTWTDFALLGWPAIILSVVSGIVQRRLRPTTVNPRPNVLKSGVLPAVLFVVAAVLFSIFL
jgi:hypothetical protein